MSSLFITIPSTTTLPLNPSPSPAPTCSTLVPAALTIISHNTMSSASTSATPARVKLGTQPPRPPNAWILYRSEKLQQLPPPLPGKPKLTQAEVSKIISAQWKAEKEDVRATYEKRAEMFKAEHARMYPNYRFAPMKKAEKERIREEKRQARDKDRTERRKAGRARPYPAPSTASPSTTSPVPLTAPFFKHEDASPPISNASSPSLGTPSSTPVSDATALSGSASPAASSNLQLPSPDSDKGSSRSSPNPGDTVSISVPLPAIPARLLPTPPQYIPPEGWRPSRSSSPLISLSPLHESPDTEWPQSGLPALQIPYSALSSSQPVAEDLEFDLALMDYERWQNIGDDSLLPPYENGVLLSSFPNHDLTAPPPPSIYLDVGQYPLGTFEPSTSSDASCGTSGDTGGMNFTAEQLIAFVNAFGQPQVQQEPVPYLDAAVDASAQSFNFEEYLQDPGGSFTGFGYSQDATSASSTAQAQAASHAPSPAPSLQLPAATPTPSFYPASPSPASSASVPSPIAHEPYVPPRGAANVSARRVAGTWKIPMAVSQAPSPAASHPGVPTSRKRARA
ncbi:hypothetical protein BC834DRAFT_871942 [Gloeopeniophorella convolvens]|nr:hypothetical protein BC834DRAFT_871942 [Gloeopeniophorella convolvens]